jgi:hypothetical protein
MFKAAKIGSTLEGTALFVVANFEPGTRPKPLRRGHELQGDGVGLGKLLTWKSGEAAKMYADLLNRGIRL